MIERRTRRPLLLFSRLRIPQNHCNVFSSDLLIIATWNHGAYLWIAKQRRRTAPCILLLTERRQLCSFFSDECNNLNQNNHCETSSTCRKLEPKQHHKLLRKLRPKEDKQQHKEQHEPKIGFLKPTQENKQKLNARGRSMTSIA